MKSKIVRALGAALLIGGSGFALGMAGTVPVHAAAVKTTDKALADAVNGMMADYKAGRYSDALAKAKQADGMSGKPANVTNAVHQMIVAAALASKDYSTALAQIEKNIATGEGDKTKNYTDAMTIALQMGNQAKASEYQNKLGGNLSPQLRLVVAQGFVNAGKYQQALDEVAPLMSNNPSEATLQFVQNIYFKMGNSAARLATLEQLVAGYPKPQYWHDVLVLAKNQKGLSDPQVQAIYRLRLAVGDLKSKDEYMDAAQQAAIANYPNEAKATVDKGVAAKVLMPNDERVGRMIASFNKAVAGDAAATAALEKQAPTDATASAKLAMVQWTYGKFPEAEASARNALKGKPADPDLAKMALGNALLSQKKGGDAVAAFNSVPKASSWATISRLWSIYARRA